MELQELIGKVNELEMENAELKGSLDEAAQRLREERALWNDEHSQLMMEIQSLKDEVARLQGSIQEIHQRNLQLYAENQHICFEMTSLLNAHQTMKARFASKQEETLNQPQERSQKTSANRYNSEEYTIKEELHQKYNDQEDGKSIFKSVPLIKSQSVTPCNAHVQDNEYDLKVFLVEDCQAENPSYGQDSFPQQRHSLRGSLRALNLIENYSAAGKQQSEHSSVFTSKYFKYPDQNHHLLDNTQHKSRLHIPEEPQLQNLQTQRNLDSEHGLPPNISAWWQPASCFLSGTCLGLYLFWQLGR